MSRTIKISKTRLTARVEPPIVDSLHRDNRKRMWIVGFIPQDTVSTHEKELVAIAFHTSEGKQISTRVDLLEHLLEMSIERVCHSGGDGFSFHSHEDHSIELQHTLRANGKFKSAYEHLQQIAIHAEHAFLIQRFRATGS